MTSAGTALPVIAAAKSRFPGRLALGLLLLCIVATTALLYGAAALVVRDKRALEPDPGLEGLSVPEFSLTTQAGETFTREELKGRVTVVDFMFTHCPFICPTLAQKMKGLQEAFRDLPEVRLVSVSVDPEHDTPAVLAEYAGKIGADPARWTFLTGDFETARRLSEDGLRLALQEDPTRPIRLGDGTVMNNVAHTGKLVVIGPDVRVIGLYSGLDSAPVAELTKRVRMAARAMPR